MMLRKLESDYDLRRFVGGDDDGGDGADSCGPGGARDSGPADTNSGGDFTGVTTAETIGGLVGGVVGLEAFGALGAIGLGLLGESLGTAFDANAQGIANAIGAATEAAGNADLSGGGIAGGAQ